MPRLSVSNGKREVFIGEGLPTVLIGERINPTGRKTLTAKLVEGDLSFVRKEAVEQEKAGADIIDVNVGAANVDEMTLLPQAVKAVAEVVDCPLCIDSSNPQALEAGLKAASGSPLVNSASGEEASWKIVLPLVKKYGARVILLCADDKGIPTQAEGRVKIAGRLLQLAEDHGLGREDVLVDCLAMSVSVDRYAALATLETISRVRDMGALTVLGASNVSFGLPDRRQVNLAFAAMAIRAGLHCLITDPLVPGLRRLIRAADLLMGHDEWAENYLKDFRKFG
jgi:5-methyltetrahydrofolate--homocysteine methyltransferase